MKFTPSTLDSFRKDFVAAVKELEKKYEATITLGNIRYSDHDFKSKIEVISKNSDGVTETPERLEYKNRAAQYGLKLEWLDKEFISLGSTYKVVGFRSRAHKYPVVVELQDRPDKGKLFKMTCRKVAAGFGV